MKIIDEFYPSADHLHQIHARLYLPDSPRAVLRICHGMCEYIERYDDFARFMAAHGFVVCGHDHLSHGKSVGNPPNYGYFAEKDGVNILLADMHTLAVRIRAQFPDLPQFLLGHSMGSLLTRQSLTQYDESLRGCVICGTLGPLAAPGASLALARVISRIAGRKKPSKLLHALAFGSYLKRISTPETPYDWICTDHAVVRRYAQDPLCTFRFTNAAMCDLIAVYGAVSRKNWAEKLPKELPILLISGEEDPCGGYGKGVTEVYHRIKNAGVAQCTLKLYPAVRHEILNDVSKETVYRDVLDFFNSLIEVPSCNI